MSSTQHYTRFSDEHYKNWLKTTESLYILRSRIQHYIEKETETYHNFLRNKPDLNGKTCEQTCDIKKNYNKPLCRLCNSWKNEISANHVAKGGIHWENCCPHLWPRNKWEVAKAYMSRGYKQHSSFAQFDVAAILNLMNFCKYFNKVPKKYVTDVITVRNRVMHSPDFKMSSEDMTAHLKTVLQLAKKLEPHAPELKDLEKEITQFNKILDKNFNQGLSEVDGQLEDLKTVKEFQTVLDREQQAMKDRIEDLISRHEENPDENVKNEPQDMKSLLDFLDQNKDLLVNLGPQVDKLKEIQEKVDQHEEKINKLDNRMGKLEKVIHDPVLPVNPLKYKNHLYEYCQKNKWTDDKFPVFTEHVEAQGFRGEVKVNGQTFTGTNVFNDKKAAHQDVANIALKELKLQEQSTDEPSTSYSSSSGILFFSKVTVDLDREFASDRSYSQEDEATEAAYKVLWDSFCINAPEEGQTYRSVIMEYFNTHGFRNPTEILFKNDDNTTICKLKLSGRFTFYDKDGSIKKKLAEQQAAKVALQHLSKILNYVPDADKNFKGVLKERLEMLGLSSPDYVTEKKEGPSEEPGTSGINQGLTTSAVSISETAVKEHSDLKRESISEPAQPTVSVPVPFPVLPDPQESSSPAAQRKKPRMDCPGISGILFFGKVTVYLNQEVASDRCSSPEDATKAAYKVLWDSFCINAPEEGHTYKSVILEYFKTHGFQKPTESFVQNDDNTTICKLKLNGPFTFFDKDGSTKKKLAEQQAAKVALQHLSKILNYGPISDAEKNFKGVLKERLEMLSLSSPDYDTEKNEGTSGISPNLSNLSISETAVKEDSDLKRESISKPAQPTVSVPVAFSVLSDPQESSSPAAQRKKPRMDCPEIDDLFNVYNLKPPHVKKENMMCDKNFKCTVQINLENCTCANKQSYDNKKEAIRKTYLLFGLAIGILDPSTDEKMSSALVKQHFSQKSLPLPQEDVQGSLKPFYCSLKNITCNVEYEKQGSSEDEAKLQALQKALMALSPLFGYSSLTGAESVEEVQNQLSSMLKKANQKDPVISLKPLEQASIQLSFCDYTLKCTCQNSKKAARNHLSARILGLLGVKTEANDASLRNRLDEWFKQQNLAQPLFVDTEEVLGAKATFSVQLTCRPDWKDSWETAKKELLEELKQRFQFLYEKKK